MSIFASIVWGIVVAHLILDGVEIVLNNFTAYIHRRRFINSINELADTLDEYEFVAPKPRKKAATKKTAKRK
jgi:hypothetical protein